MTQPNRLSNNPADYKCRCGSPMAGKVAVGEFYCPACGYVVPEIKLDDNKAIPTALKSD